MTQCCYRERLKMFTLGPVEQQKLTGPSLDIKKAAKFSCLLSRLHLTGRS